MGAVRYSFLALLLLGVAAAARAELEFAGYFITAQEARFTLTDRDLNRSSGWLKLGQSFAGHTLVAFDRSRHSLTVRRGDETTILALRAAKVQEGRTPVSGSMRIFDEHIEGVQTVLFLDELNVFPVKDGISLRIVPTRRPDGTIHYRSSFELQHADGSSELLTTPDIVARPGTRFSVRVGEVGFDFTP
jgi:hypothetical protein